MQVVLSIDGSHRPSNWVSAQGDYATVTSELMRHARRDLNLSPAEDAEVEALVRSWTPSDGYPLPADEDVTRVFPCNGFTMHLTARSPERQEQRSREIDDLLGITHS